MGAGFPRCRATVLVFLVASGCTYVPTRSLHYVPVSVSVSAAPSSVVVVRDLGEARQERRYSSAIGHTFMTYIPLIPYIEIPYERLDESDQLRRRKNGEAVAEDSHFTVSMSKVIASDLRSAGLFREVRYVGSGPIPSDADFVLEGDLQSTRFDTYVTSYMLGMAGVLLWLLPIPLGKNKARVEVDLRLSDRAGREVWTTELRGEGSRTFTFYNSSGAAITNPMMLEIKKYSTNDERRRN